MFEIGTDTKRENYTPNIKCFKLIGMNLCSVSVCPVFYQWVGVICLYLLFYMREKTSFLLSSTDEVFSQALIPAPLCLWCHE